jgi:hypothetical protein
MYPQHVAKKRLRISGRLHKKGGLMPPSRPAPAVSLLAGAGAVLLLVLALFAKVPRRTLALRLRGIGRVVRAIRAPVPGIRSRCLNVGRHLMPPNRFTRPRPRAAREICRCCWRPSPVGFSVPDEVWKQSVHPRFQASVLCLGCFARFADERLVTWDEEIEFWPVSAASMTEGVGG